jgi:hypothetical protein
MISVLNDYAGLVVQNEVDTQPSQDCPKFLKVDQFAIEEDFVLIVEHHALSFGGAPCKAKSISDVSPPNASPMVIPCDLRQPLHWVSQPSQGA